MSHANHCRSLRACLCDQFDCRLYRSLYYRRLDDLTNGLYTSLYLSLHNILSESLHRSLNEGLDLSLHHNLDRSLHEDHTS